MTATSRRTLRRILLSASVLLAVASVLLLYFQFYFSPKLVKFVNQTDFPVTGDIISGTQTVETVAIPANRTVRWRFYPENAHIEKSLTFSAPLLDEPVTLDGYLLPGSEHTVIVFVTDAHGVLAVQYK